MRYKINLESGPTEPFDEAQLVSLYQAGAITRSSRVRAEQDGAELTALDTALPIVIAVKPLSEIAGALRAEIAKDRFGTLKRIDLPFWHTVGVIFQFAIASIPAALLLWLLGAGLTILVAGFVSALGNAR